jgi:hypothetical protein
LGGLRPIELDNGIARIHFGSVTRKLQDPEAFDSCWSGYFDRFEGLDFAAEADGIQELSPLYIEGRNPGSVVGVAEGAE